MQISEKINVLQRRDREFQKKYECLFEDFAKQTAENATYVEELEASGHWMWESDLAEWEFCRKGLNDWTDKLAQILTSK
jgi:hypothetical protein